MSLINCPECGHEMSTDADTCPKCGRPIFGIPYEHPTPVYVTEAPRDSGGGSVAGQILLGLLFGGAIIGFFYVFFVAPQEASQPTNTNTVHVVVPSQPSSVTVNETTNIYVEPRERSTPAPPPPKPEPAETQKLEKPASSEAAKPAAKPAPKSGSANSSK